ncbi:UDP-N-acetylmuramoyl-L-alanyl-D-glutamate--2,6-diaminopimelate ligase [Gilvimarinus sp. SDUM040013]|uniref:UDP-N-acetylmuramoyl-L-alanyl-D-glutamate--2,6-diaminopimelate ligase n=1 Tax=Gilvimarinus gilvus TaxID=3058038 RepID=A0ABU4RUS0_9GAMM|nr:UDP-N-acetylmuramoyl-L-alanyl-D-glutamate--2,6-diaminopimelate ligase [Gilvimarinus sp. SDUM040013]MDO3388396.1 UDP-N-acetylmuramoyl-L-alanyl-D-glutamate--2,6-diaminopimelate ligase [Gilvimarinus sp. SDUM040013]MDX6847946.1 UDP-N-acetylmuramoyl-L-alanyl-D-glutamate--2,6-diaminopimelate ligase [Gilvimarinus sp. SDUM040013]
MASVKPLPLEALVSELDQGLAAEVLNGITQDSRKVLPGNVFVALKGARVDATDFIDDALQAGAVAVLADKAGFDKRLDDDKVIWVEKLDKQLSHLAGIVYGDPSTQLDVIGVTGTNGKTTCTLLIAQLLQQLGKSSAVMGTLGYGCRQESLVATGLTTPDPITTQRLIRELVDSNVECLAMEVSSHALIQHRVKDVCITTGVFTNLSHDHLDYHGDIKQYGKAKAKLLKSRNFRHAVLNIDDSWCQSLQARAARNGSCLTYSTRNPKADLFCSSLDYSCEGVSGYVHYQGETAEFSSPLIGEFNTSNLLAAVAAALLRGYSLAETAPLLPTLKPAPGRMEQVSIGGAQDIQVVVDYAHTPDALIKALRAVKQHTKGSLWCVFGCGGNRDADKRPVMGRAAEKTADYVIVTNDNPRNEDPAVIASQIVRGMHSPERCLVIAERDKAIALAVQQAAKGDAVLIAGKGHEQVQIFADTELAFSDVDCARQALAKRRVGA